MKYQREKSSTLFKIQLFRGSNSYWFIGLQDYLQAHLLFFR